MLLSPSVGKYSHDNHVCEISQLLRLSWYWNKQSCHKVLTYRLLILAQDSSLVMTILISLMESFVPVFKHILYVVSYFCFRLVCYLHPTVSFFIRLGYKLRLCSVPALQNRHGSSVKGFITRIHRYFVIVCVCLTMLW